MRDRTAGGSVFLEAETTCGKALQFRDGGTGW